MKQWSNLAVTLTVVSSYACFAGVGKVIYDECKDDLSEQKNAWLMWKVSLAKSTRGNRRPERYGNE